MSKGQEILVMTVNITDNSKDKIIVHEFDQPESLAKDFILKHGLNPRLISPLTNEILLNISDLLRPSPYHKNSIKELPSRPESSELSSTSNYGERLYTKGLKKLEKTEYLKQALKSRLDEESSKELTFKPKINPVSEIIAQRMANRSHDSIRRKESAIARFQNEKSAEELNACTFAPKINPHSSKILQSKQRSGSNRFVELYEDFYKRKIKQEHMEKLVEFPFRPEILQMENVSSSGERLYFKKPAEESKNSQNDLCDPKTGQEFFVPKVNEARYPRYREVPIGEHLYRQRRDYTENPEPVNSNPTFEAKARTETLIRTAKKRRYRELFDQLNPDESDIISFKRINSKFVEPVPFKLMQPLLDELREEEETLDFEQFSNSMDNLLKILSPDERDVFLIWKRNKEEGSQVSLNRKSLSSYQASGVYNRQIEKRLGAQARLELEREKKVRNELNGCTFHPQTTLYRNNKRIDIE